ncbi:hypothetical protein, partial [Marivivens marinus]|uniref:hypothetical protein n=1 Tax=Marivivens marinus TaxID=3110173 RepID=UPI003B84AC3B
QPSLILQFAGQTIPVGGPLSGGYSIFTNTSRQPEQRRNNPNGHAKDQFNIDQKMWGHIWVCPSHDMQNRNQSVS